MIDTKEGSQQAEAQERISNDIRDSSQNFIALLFPEFIFHLSSCSAVPSRNVKFGIVGVFVEIRAYHRVLSVRSHGNRQVVRMWLSLTPIYLTSRYVVASS